MIRTRPISADNTSSNKIRTRPARSVESTSAVIGKSFLKGLTSLADIPQALAQHAANVNRDYGPHGEDLREYAGEYYTPTPEISLGTPISQLAREGVKNVTGYNLEPNPTTPFQRAVGKGAEFGGGAFGFGAPSAAAKGVFNLAKNVGTGSAIGGASGVAQEMGANPLAADLASSFVTPSAIGKSKGILNAVTHPLETATKVGHKITGLGPNSLNIKAAQAARDLDIDLPTAALTNSKLTALGEQYMGKVPYFGDVIKKKYANTEKQTKSALENIYDKTGPRKTPEVEARISKAYDKVAKILPEDAVVRPTNSLKAIDDIKINSALLSTDEKNLLASLKELRNKISPQLNSKFGTPSKEFGNIKIPVQDFSVNTLIGTKKSLNSIIKWDMDEGVKNQLRRVQKGISEDIADYGKKNPEWYSKFKDADKLFGDVAKREKIENILSGKGVNYATDSISYNALAKSINDPAKAKLLKKNVTPEIWDKIQKLGDVSKSLAIKNQNIPNPSGTAPTAAAISAGLYAWYNPSTIIPTVIAGGAATKLLTDKKFIDLALKYAESGGKNKLTAMALNTRMKQFGYTAISLNNELQRMQKKEDKKQ